MTIAVAGLIGLIPTTYRIKAAIFSSYFLAAVYSMMTPFALLGSIVDPQAKPRDTLIWITLALILVFAGFHLLRWLKKRQNRSD